MALQTFFGTLVNPAAIAYCEAEATVFGWNADRTSCTVLVDLHVSMIGQGRVRKLVEFKVPHALTTDALTYVQDTMLSALRVAFASGADITAYTVRLNEAQLAECARIAGHSG